MFHTPGDASADILFVCAVFAPCAVQRVQGTCHIITDLLSLILSFFCAADAQLLLTSITTPGMQGSCTTATDKHCNTWHAGFYAARHHDGRLLHWR